MCIYVCVRPATISSATFPRNYSVLRERFVMWPQPLAPPVGQKWSKSTQKLPSRCLAPQTGRTISPFFNQQFANHLFVVYISITIERLWCPVFGPHKNCKATRQNESMAEEKAKELDKKGSDILVGGGWKLLWSRGRSSALLAPPQHFHRRRWWPRRRERAREGAALLPLCLLSAFLPFSPSFALSPSFSLSSSLSFHTLIRCDVSTSCSFYS